MKPKGVTGLDLFIKKGEQSDSKYIANNSGPRKLYPIRPTCQFKGKWVPCMFCNTESGSITSELLDEDIFPQDDGIKPF
jgi:hypothetical protein